MKFFDPLVLRWVSANQWVLEKELRCETFLGDVIYIPAGSSTDLASIPKIIWPILSPAGPWARSSVVHDECYRNPSRKFTRARCDEIFLEGMRADGVDVASMKAIYTAVRAFGSSSYVRRQLT